MEPLRPVPGDLVSPSARRFYAKSDRHGMTGIVVFGFHCDRYDKIA